MVTVRLLTWRLLLGAVLLPWAKPDAQRPPISPHWVFDHWVWEDDENSRAALFEMLDGYEKRGIPVGAVIIDSPWSTEYNNFVWDEAKYPDPQGMLDALHRRGVKVLVWVTAIINNEYNDDPREPKGRTLYEEAKAKGYLLNDGATYKWWKGRGAFIDATNPEAVEWWHKVQDRALNMGIDGYKIDEVAFASFPSIGQGKNGRLTRTKYWRWYYRDFYEHGLRRNPEFVTMPRSVDKTVAFAPLDVAPASWVGDQKHTWEGLREAVGSVFRAAELGYAVVGSDTAGYHGDVPISKRLLIRWAQFSALNPLFENGGHGAHEPWRHDEETVSIYRYWVKLHLALKPFFYSLTVQAHRGRGNVLTPDHAREQFSLGGSLLVAVLHGDGDERTVHLPEGTWVDAWSGQVHQGPKTFAYQATLKTYPVFLKAGGIVPLEITDDELGLAGEWAKGRDVFWVVAGASGALDYAPYLQGGEQVVPVHLISDKRRTQVEVAGGGRRKAFVLENVASVKDVSGEGKTYAASHDLSGCDDCYHYDPVRRRLTVRSSSEGALALRVRHGLGAK